MALRATDELEGESLQRITGEDRRPLVISLPYRWLAAPQFVVVHRRQIVVHQRVAMDAFDCRGGRQRRLAFDAEKGGRVENKIGAETLAPRQNRMAQRLGQPPRRTCGFLFRQNS